MARIKINRKYKMYFVLFYIFLSVFIKSSGQFFYQDFIYLAEEQIEKKNYAGALVPFQQAFKKRSNPELEDLYNYACCKALVGHVDNAIKILVSISRKGFANISIVGDSDLTALHSDKRWFYIVNRINENKRKADLLLNRDLKEKLSELYKNDQKFRNELNLVYQSANSEIKQKRALSDSIEKSDSLNIAVLEEILSKYGWPGVREAGGLGNFAAFLVFQHANLDFQIKYLPLLKNSIKSKNSPGEYIAFITDRILVRKGEKQIYGTQTEFDDLKKKYSILPVKDVEKMRKLRGDLGMISIELYLKKINEK